MSLKKLAEESSMTLGSTTSNHGPCGCCPMMMPCACCSSSNSSTTDIKPQPTVPSTPTPTPTPPTPTPTPKPPPPKPVVKEQFCTLPTRTYKDGSSPGDVAICGEEKEKLRGDEECVPMCARGYKPEDETPFVCVRGKKPAKDALQPPPLLLALSTSREKPMDEFTCIKLTCRKAEDGELQGCDKELTFGDECELSCKDSKKVMTPELYKMRCDVDGLVPLTEEDVRCEKKPCEAIRDVTSYVFRLKISLSLSFIFLELKHILKHIIITIIVLIRYEDEEEEERLFCADPDNECVLSCKPGWKLPTKLNGARVCGEDSTWNDITNNEYECERMQCTKLENVNYKGCDKDVDFGSECSVTCAKESFHMISLEDEGEDSTPTVESNKYKCECTATSCNLEPEIEVRCIPKPCPKIPDRTIYTSQSSSSERFACEETAVGDTCDLRCMEKEFELPIEVSEHSQLKCEDTSTWKPALDSLTCVKRKCEAVLSLSCTPTSLGETCVAKCSDDDEILVSNGVEVTSEVTLMCTCEDETCETRLFKNDEYTEKTLVCVPKICGTSSGSSSSTTGGETTTDCTQEAVKRCVGFDDVDNTQTLGEGQTCTPLCVEPNARPRIETLNCVKNGDTMMLCPTKNECEVAMCLSVTFSGGAQFVQTVTEGRLGSSYDVSCPPGMMFEGTLSL